ncbi:MAG: ABC transporter ATP-binding protein [Sphingorhabdus sp.]
MIAVNNLSLTLQGRRVLQDISAQFEAGKITVILGPNGAGKSSLLGCIAALHQPAEGNVCIGGEDVQKIDANKRARMIGYLPQNGEVHWNLNVRALVALGRLPHHHGWQETPDDQAAIDAAIDQAGIEALASRKVQRLSGGEQGRVLLARVLAGQPQWILADEPLANLDPAHSLDIADLFRSAAKSGAGIVLVLHDLTLAANIADHVLLLKGGRLLASGTSEKVLTPTLIREAYGVGMEILEDESGGRTIITKR